MENLIKRINIEQQVYEIFDSTAIHQGDVIQIENGGTSGSTVEEARNNLKIYSKEESHELFSEKNHIHEINEINGLQRRLDELTPPLDIETSEDLIIRVNQMYLAIGDMKTEIQNMKDIIDGLIPSIGEIYITISNENPSIKFGGSWEQIKDVFLLAAGDEYVADSTGGEAEHILTIEEMPTHTHTYKRHTFDRNDTDPETGENVYGANIKILDAREGTTSPVGGGQAHNNMPPYLVVYVWKRIS